MKLIKKKLAWMLKLNNKIINIKVIILKKIKNRIALVLLSVTKELIV
jgi:hypothetical protein